MVAESSEPVSVVSDSQRVFIITVSGSRGITDRERVWQILDEESAYYLCLGYELLWRLGDAHGVDYLALEWARERGFSRRVYFADKDGYATWVGSAGLLADDGAESAVLAADWDRDGKTAGQIRNSAMLGVFVPHQPKSELLIAIWDAASPGTRNCMAAARNANIFIHQWGGEAPITFRTPSPRDAELVEHKGAL